VELAQLKYLLPRLVGAGDALSRLGGGIGTRGPGETKLETDRRRIRTRIHAVSEDIERVRKRRGQLRERRHKASVPTVALVGYTNAGKTTLFNVLTRADAEVSDALFVTLDPLVRQVRLPDSRELLVSDTVGFIDRLPHALVAAFRATLEETADADLVLHVIDASASDRDRRMTAVNQVLTEVGAVDVPLLEVYNKCDALTADERRRLQERDPSALCISALKGDVRRVTLTFDPDSAADRERIARVYRHARVVLHEARDGRVSIVADVPRRLLSRLGAS
jgi:GTP-binding protein HflX